MYLSIAAFTFLSLALYIRIYICVLSFFLYLVIKRYMSLMEQVCINVSH